MTIHTGGQALKERKNPALYPEHWPTGIDEDYAPTLCAYNERERETIHHTHWRTVKKRLYPQAETGDVAAC